MPPMPIGAPPIGNPPIGAAPPMPIGAPMPPMLIEAPDLSRSYSVFAREGPQDRTDVLTRSSSYRAEPWTTAATSSVGV